MSVPWVLVTGCSTGIGRSLVWALRQRGWGVVATARRLESLKEFQTSDYLKTLLLDVTDDTSVACAVEACRELRLIALINNAGYGQMGPLELLRPEEVGAQLETNVIGLHRVTRAFLPLIKSCANPGEGRIVHVSSVLGRLSIPMAGAYNASKHAVSALGETLRLEIGRTIPIMLVEPGAIKTQFRVTIRSAWGDLPERAVGTRYEKAIHQYAAKRENFADKRGMSADDCAALIAKAMEKRRPPRRLIIGRDSYWGQVAHRWLPAALFEWIMRKSYGLSETLPCESK